MYNTVMVKVRVKMILKPFFGFPHPFRKVCIVRINSAVVLAAKDFM